MANFLFFGAPIDANIEPEADYRRRFEATGFNTGNLLIGNSLFKELVFDGYHFGIYMPPEQVNEEFDLIVIPAANFIYEKFDFGSYADFLEATDLPCLMVGLGAQAPSAADRKMNIPDGTRRFLSIVSERTKVIGVRGDFTANVLGDMGIRNVRSVGCPSFYRSLTRELNVRQVPDRPLKVSINGSSNVFAHSCSPAAAKRVEGQLIALSVMNGYDYVLQNEEPEMDVLAGGALTADLAAQIDTLRRRFEIPLSQERFVNHIRSHYRLFFSVDEWDDYIRGFDMSIGSRFHGNIVALTAGVPAVIITHDARTAELCSLMHIPHVGIDEIGYVDIDDLYSRADFDAWGRQYRLLYDRYAEFLSENGVEHRLTDAEPTVRSGGRLTPTPALAQATVA